VLVGEEYFFENIEEKTNTKKIIFEILWIKKKWRAI